MTSNPALIQRVQMGELVPIVTLRDLFAAAALSGLCAAPIYALPDGELAKAAYRHADAMLKARADGAESTKGDSA